jgi:hypothetical protein
MCPNRHTRNPRMRRRLVFVLDWLMVLALLVTLIIELSGGFFMRAGELRISARSPDRSLLIALALLGIRLLIDRETDFLRVPGGRWRLLAGWLYHPSSDRLPLSRLRVGPRQLAVSAAIFCAVGGVLLHEQLRDLYLVPDLGDPLFSIWRLGWVFRQLQGDPRSLFDANIFHPEPLTLTYSDSILLPALTAAPLLASGLHPVKVYNLLLLSGFLLTGLTTFLLVHRLTGCTRAAIISALLFGFYPYRFEHYPHLELQMTHWMPLGLLALHRFAETLRVRDLLLAAFCGAAQLYSSMYYGVFLPLYGSVVAAILCLSRGVPFRHVLKPIAFATAAGIVLSAPLVVPYMSAQTRKGIREAPEVQFYSATAEDYLRAHDRSARYTGHLLPAQPERALFPGITPLALAAAALAPPLGPTRVAYLAGLLAAFDGSRGMNGLAYPYLYAYFPPARGLRVPARFSVLVGLSLAVLAGFATRRLLGRLPPWKGHLVFGVLVLVIVADLQPRVELQPVWREPPHIYTSVDPTGFVLAEFPFPTDPLELMYNLPYMYFSLWHGAEMVNGYSGFSPPDYPEFSQSLAGFPNEPALSRLRQRGVTHVTVNCALYGDRCETVLEAIAASPALHLVAESEWQGEIVNLYELR